MKDLHINIGGPRDQARQRVSVRIAQAEDRSGWNAEQVASLVGEIRQALGQSTLSAEETRRIERHLAAIEEESRSPKPLLDEISSAIQSVQRLVQAASTAAPTLMGPLRALAAAVGLG